MKRKVLAIVLVLFLMPMMLCTSSYAANICDVEATATPSTIKPGDEVNITVAVKNITEAIAGVSFTLNYDDEDTFDFVSATAGSNWTVTRVENSYTVLTEDFESTTTAGTIVTIKLKAKSTITEGSTKDITLSSVEISKDDALKICEAQGKLEVACNFCNKKYSYTKEEIEKLFVNK